MCFHFLQGCSSQEEAVTWQEMKSRDLMWPEVTRKWRHLTGSPLEVAVQGRKLTYTVCFTSYKAVARRRKHLRDRKWHHVTSVTWSDPEVTSLNRKSLGRGCRRSKTHVYCTFYFLQCCSSQEEAVTWHETSCDLRERMWPGSDSFDL